MIFGMHKPNIDVVQGGYHFRSIQEQDKRQYMTLRTETSRYAEIYKTVEGLSDYSWEQDLKDKNAIFMVVFREADGQFVAACSFQGIQGESVELGYDVVNEYRGQGIGTDVVKALIVVAHSVFPDKRILIRVRKDNAASQRVAEKCGAKQIEITDAPEMAYINKLLQSEKMVREE